MLLSIAAVLCICSVLTALAGVALARRDYGVVFVALLIVGVSLAGLFLHALRTWREA